jgi:opacity protein-like surface antigen
MQKRIPLFVVVMIVACLSTSAAIASGPYGAPMSLLEHGQWAWDVGYAYEELDVFGCIGFDETYAYWEGEDWGDPYRYGWEECFRVTDLETQAALASIEYGLCDNWDIFFRLGMAKAEGDIAWRDWYDTGEDYIPYWFKESADFDWGLAWQVGTNFTICQQGPWTWGGRMQFGMADPDSDSWTYRDSEDEYEWTETCSADIEMYQALAYIGPSYQPSDTWLLYSGIGWQCVHVTMDYNCRGVEYEGEELYERWSEDGSGKLKHYSAIGLFGAAWMPNDKARVSADVLIGEAGKVGWSIIGQFPF